MSKTPAKPPASQTPTTDDVVRRMLNTPPKPRNTPASHSPGPRSRVPLNVLQLIAEAGGSRNQLRSRSLDDGLSWDDEIPAALHHVFVLFPATCGTITLQSLFSDQSQPTERQ